MCPRKSATTHDYTSLGWETTDHGLTVDLLGHDEGIKKK